MKMTEKIVKVLKGGIPRLIVSGVSQHGFVVPVRSHEPALGFGLNVCGQLGLGHSNPISKLEGVKFGFGVKSIRSASVGYRHSVFLAKNSKVVACGSNEMGQVCPVNLMKALKEGERKEKPIHTPFEVPIKEVVMCAVAGYSTSFYVVKGNRVYATGANSRFFFVLFLIAFRGQLGIGKCYSDVAENFHEVILPPTEILKEIVGGYEYTCFLMSSGASYMCGCFAEGKMGILKGNVSEENLLAIKTPTLVSFSDQVILKDVKCGVAHTLFLTDKNLVYSAGYNEESLGYNNDSHQRTPKMIPPLLYDLVDAERICVGRDHSLLVNKNNVLYSFGLGSKGQLGTYNSYYDGYRHYIKKVEMDPNERIIQINCGYSNSYVMTIKRGVGRIYAWGYNCELQCCGYPNIDKFHKTFIPLPVMALEFRGFDQEKEERLHLLILRSNLFEVVRGM